MTQHTCDKNLEPRKVHVHLEVDPPLAWYYQISLNFYTLVILLQVDPASSNELQTIYERCYEIEDTFIFTWSSIFCVGHYC